MAHSQRTQAVEVHSRPAPPTRNRRILASLATAQPTIVYLRDGEVVVYRRTRSLLYQCRYKLANGNWHRQTTGASSIETAIARACEIYDEARYRTRLGLAHRTHLFAHIAQLTLGELGAQVDAPLVKTGLLLLEHQHVVSSLHLAGQGQGHHPLPPVRCNSAARFCAALLGKFCAASWAI